MEVLNDLEYDQEEEDNESFKSAIAFPPTTAITESFIGYSYTVCVNPLSLEFDSSSHDSDFEDAHDELSEDDIETIEHVSYPEEHNNLSANAAAKDIELKSHSMSRIGKSNNSVLSKETARIHPIKVKSMSFNQDRDCVAIATSKGIEIRTIDDLTKSHVHKLDIKGGINCIQVLHRTSLLAISKSKTPRIVSFIYGKNGRVLKELSFTSAVRRVEMNRLCLAVLTASGELHIFAYGLGKQKEDIRFLTSIGLLHKSESARMMTADGATLQGSFFELASQCVSGETWLVTKSVEGIGYVSVYKISTAQIGRSTCQDDVQIPCIKLINTICAHNHSVCKLALGGISESSKMIDLVFATASVKGTLIRVFSMTTGEKLYEFQRGSSSCTIHSLAFNSDATILAVSGSKGTVHLFQLSQENRVQANNRVNATKSNGLRPMLKQWISGRNNNQVENVVRSFARIRIKGEYARMPNIVTLGATNKINENVEENVVICPLDGTLIQYAVNRKGKKRPVRAEKFFTQNDGN